MIGKAEEKVNNVLGLIENSVPIAVIAKSLKMSEAEVLQVIGGKTKK